MSQLAKAAAAVRELRKKGAKPLAVFAGSEEGVETDHFNVIPMPVRRHLSIGVAPCTLVDTARAATLLGDRCSGVIYVGSNWQHNSRYVEFPIEAKGVMQLRVVRLPYLDHFSIGLK